MVTNSQWRYKNEKGWIKKKFESPISKDQTKNSDRINETNVRNRRQSDKFSPEDPIIYEVVKK